MQAEKVFASLSRRENDVVDLLLQGMSNKQIALALGVSERTVEFHLKNVFVKLQVASRVELILKLGRTPGGIFTNLVESTVVVDTAIMDNGNQPAQPRAAQSWRNTVSLIKKEVAMTIRISFEDVENYLRSHPILLSVLMFCAASLTTRYAVFSLGLYYWVSYLLLGLLIGAGSIYFGLAWKKMVNGNMQFRPLLLIACAGLLPLIAAGFDQVYLNTVLRFTEPIATSVANISATAAWLVSPEGDLYRSTNLSVTSDGLWFIALAYMLILFFLSRVAGTRSDKNNLATV
jgi:DNA-binding CsgD family transcriptional regulator